MISLTCLKILPFIASDKYLTTWVCMYMYNSHLVTVYSEGIKIGIAAGKLHAVDYKSQQKQAYLQEIWSFLSQYPLKSRL